MGTLDGKVAIITGAARGQGAAEAQLFAERGAKVMLCDVLDDEGAKVAADIGDAAAYMRLDVTDEQGSIWALDRETGTSVWKQDGLRFRYVTAPTYFNGYVVAGDFEGYLHWMDAETGEFVYRAQIDDTRIIAPAIDAGGVLLGYATSGRLVAMRPK